MTELPLFPDKEYDTRLVNLRQRMAEHGLENCLISTPENIYYLTGLNHQGYFVYHLLIVPLEGELYLITRAMERVTVENQVKRVRFVGYSDSADPAQITCQVLTDLGLSTARLGLEKNSALLSFRIAEGLLTGLPQAQWQDASHLVAELRLIKSPLELAYMRQAAAVSDAMMKAAMATVRAGVSEREIAAEVHREMLIAGGDYPGFSPFIRSTPRLGEEHTTWSDRRLQPGDTLFLELAGCVARYHAPVGRLIFIDKAPTGTQAMARICRQAFQQVVHTIRPGITAKQVYQAWQDVVDQAGFTHYRRHHCGYLVGIGFPPSWVGGSMVVGLRHDSDLVLQPGMTFHLLSWLMGAGQGDYFVSDTAVLTKDRCEVLTTVPQEVQVV